LSICDYHLVFGESLAHTLAAHGKEVVAVTHHPDQLVEVLRSERVDMCVLDVVFGGTSVVDRLTDLRAVAHGIPFVLLTAEVDAALLAAARTAGVRGVADKRQPIAEFIGLLDRVYAGDSVVLTRGGLPARWSPGRRPINEAHRLAAFLTPRERQVLSALVRGADTTKLAHSMGITATTARCHIQNVLTKLGAHSRLEAATTAVRQGMVSPETGDWLTPGGVPSVPRSNVVAGDGRAAGSSRRASFQTSRPVGGGTSTTRNVRTVGR
jgi:two-component system nitrate/nitrite response regulator NarL